MNAQDTTSEIKLQHTYRLYVDVVFETVEELEATRQRIIAEYEDFDGDVLSFIAGDMAAEVGDSFDEVRTFAYGYEIVDSAPNRIEAAPDTSEPLDPDVWGELGGLLGGEVTE